MTQQLAKQLFTEQYDRTSWLERALLQKPKEWIIAARLERHYTKEEILALYLNRYDFLNQAVGIKSAANIYFDKEVNELDVHESAMLVGMLSWSAKTVNLSALPSLSVSSQMRIRSRPLPSGCFSLG